MINTDPLSIVFLVCFLSGLVFFVVTALLGNLGHGATHAGTHHVHAPAVHHAGTHVAHTPAHPVAHATQGTGQHSTTKAAPTNQSSLFAYFNPTSLMLFLLGFGFFGYLLHNIVHLVIPLFTLGLAAVGGIIVAALLLLAISRIFGDSEATTVQDVSDRTGMLGKVSLTIQEGGIGEIIYVSPGGMRKSVPARSIDGRRIERDEEVVVTTYRGGVAEVDTWEHFIQEEGHAPQTFHPDELEELRSLLDESSTIDVPPLVMRNDAQTE
jgi:hypothetical protein